MPRAGWWHLVEREGRRPGRRRLAGSFCAASRCAGAKTSNRAIVHRLGVTEKAVRKLAGPSKPASASLHPATSTAAEKPAAISLSSPVVCDILDIGRRRWKASALICGEKEGGHPVAAPEAADDERCR